MKVPAVLPLDAGKITCRTCHTAHTGATGADRETIAKRGDPLANTIFLRVTNDAGQLCTHCHQAELVGPKAGSHIVGPIKKPVPPSLVALGASAGNDGRQLNCQTCHTSHGSPERPLLISSVQDNGLCANCHSYPSGSGLHPQLVRLSKDSQQQAIAAMGTHSGPGQTLICTSCHKVTRGPESELCWRTP